MIVPNIWKVIKPVPVTTNQLCSWLPHSTNHIIMVTPLIPPIEFVQPTNPQGLRWERCRRHLSTERDVHPIAGLYRCFFSRFCCRYLQVFSPLCFFFSMLFKVEIYSYGFPKWGFLKSAHQLWDCLRTNNGEIRSVSSTGRSSILLKRKEFWTRKHG